MFTDTRWSHEVDVVAERHLHYIDQVIGKREGTQTYACMNGLILPGRQIMLADAEIVLSTARTARAGAMRDCRARATGCLNAITVQAAGSEQAIKDLSMDVAQRLESPLETTPQGLVSTKSKISAAAGWSWKTHKGNHGFMVQYGSDPNQPATYSTPTHCTKGQFHATGQTPGATLHLRVAALDARLPGGQTAWSTWIASVVSL